MKLYELTNELQALLDRIGEAASENDGLVQPELWAELQTLQGDWRAKVDNCAKAVRNMNAEADLARARAAPFAAEAKRWSAKAKALDSRADALKEYIRHEMNAAGERKANGDFTVFLSALRPRVNASPDATLPDDLVEIIPAQRLADEDKIIARWRAGGEAALPPGVSVMVGECVKIR